MVLKGQKARMVHQVYPGPRAPRGLKEKKDSVENVEIPTERKMEKGQRARKVTGVRKEAL